MTTAKSRDDRFDVGPTGLVEQVDFIDHEESQALHKRVVSEGSAPPAGENLELLGSGEDDVIVRELLMQFYSEG